MAILSNFEVLLSRIAAPPDSTIPLSAPFRRVVQGYFLTVSNPVINTTPAAVTFELFFTINFTSVTSVANLTDSNNAFFRSFVSDPANPNPLSPNHVLVINKEPDNVLGSGITQSVLIPDSTLPSGPTPTAQKFKSIPITIGIGQTFSIALLPNSANSVVLNSSSMAIRGYSEIVEVPPAGKKTLIISAEHRGTFLDNNYPSYNNETMDFDQIAYALPMFEGCSKVTI
jgi:hypothetical protein